MKYYIVHTRQSDTGETHEKWLPSAHYELSAEYLLKQMEAQLGDFDFLVVPFVLTLCAGLEANLNDWFIVDTFAKHGIEQYKPLAEGYTGTSFAKKLRIIVAVLTDNTFQLREDSPVVQQLDKSIAARNKITHPLAHYHVESQSETEGKSHGAKLTNHPLHSLTLEECRNQYQAVIEFESKFFQQYDNGFIVENDLIRELKRVGQQVSEEQEAHMMTVVCSTKDAENRVIGIFIGHGLQLGQGYVTFGPSMPDNPNVYLSINISLPAAKLDQIGSEVSKIAGAVIPKFGPN